MHLLVGAALLREIVHWSDWQDGKVSAFEAGKAFGREAYGRDVRRY